MSGYYPEIPTTSGKEEIYEYQKIKQHKIIEGCRY